MPRKSNRPPKPNPKYNNAPTVTEKKTQNKKPVVKDIKTKKQEKKEHQKELLEKKKEKVIQQQKNQQEEEKVKVILNKKLQKQKRLEELYIPDDDITTNINKSLIKLKSLFLEKKTSFPDSLVNGTQVLEVKPQDYQVPKVILWSKFKNGDYHTPDSKSDKAVVSDVIKTITKNFPSFIKYKDVEDLSWIINNHRELFYETIEHISNKKLAPATFKSYINVILRISRLGYNSKSSTIYTKYATIMDELSKCIATKEKDQGLNEIEKTKFLEWKHVMYTRNKIEKEFNDLKTNPLKKKQAFNKNQDLMLTSIYTLTPVLRREVATLKFTNKKPRDKKGDYVYFHPKDNKVSLELYEIKKRHDYISIPLNYREESKPTGFSKFIMKNQEHLAKLLKESFELYERDYVFVNTVKYNKEKKIESVSAESVAKRLAKIYKNYKVNVGASSLRSSYITYLNNLYIKQTGNVLTTAEKEELAIMMRTSREQLDSAYCKIFRNNDEVEIPVDAILFDDDNNEIKVKKENDENSNDENIDHIDENIGYEREELKTELIKPAYERHLERVKKAYNDSKVIEVKKDDGTINITTEARENKRLYYYKRDKYEMNRNRILREYHNPKKLRSLTQGTINKYKFTEEELNRDVK